MAIKDWITFPRTEDGWPTKANAWMNDLVSAVRDLTTRLTTAEADIVALEAEGEYSTYVPTLFNCAGAFTYAESCRVGDMVHVLGLLVLSAAPTGVIGIGLPVATTRLGVINAGQAVGTIGVQRYKAEIDNVGTYVNFLRADDMGVANAYWAAAVPGIWANGSVISFSFVYRVL